MNDYIPLFIAPGGGGTGVIDGGSSFIEGWGGLTVEGSRVT